MMKKKQTIRDVSSIVTKMLKDPLFSGASVDSVIRENWAVVLGETLASRIEFIGLQDETILVSSRSAVSKNEFVFRAYRVNVGIKLVIKDFCGITATANEFFCVFDV